MDAKPGRLVPPRPIGDIAKKVVDAALRRATIHHYAGHARENDGDDNPALLANSVIDDFEEALKGRSGREVIKALRQEAGRTTAGPEAPPEERGVAPRSPRRMEFFVALMKAIDRRFPA